MPDLRLEGGLFISFEGGEGAGKTSQINRLGQFLASKGYRVVTTREPGGTPEGEALRSLLVQRGGGSWNPMAETLLMLAGRGMHVEKVIKPALDHGKIVISDRFSDSTLAYQGYGRGLDRAKLEALTDMVLEGFAPDLTFVLDIAVVEGLSRSTKRIAAEAHDNDESEDRFERMGIEFHERIRQGFLDIAKASPGRCNVLDASRRMDEIAGQIEAVVMSKIGAL